MDEEDATQAPGKLREALDEANERIEGLKALNRRLIEALRQTKDACTPESRETKESVAPVNVRSDVEQDEDGDGDEGERVALPFETTDEYIVDSFTFGCGETMPLRQRYSTLGKLQRDPDSGLATNAVLVLHGTTGSGSQFLKGNVRRSFAEPLFGEGGLLDAAKNFIIFPDGIGHGKSSRPSEGMRMSFPSYDYDDMIKAQYMLLTEHLGVDHLLLVMGTSMGGMHTWLWGEKYPTFMDALFPLACNPVEIAGMNRMVRKAAIDAVREDPDFNGGLYAAGSRLRGQACAVRMMALRMSAAPLRWYNEAPTRVEAEEMLEKITERYMARLEPTDMIFALDASRNYNPDPELLSIVAPLTAVNSADDQVNPPELGVLERAVARLRGAGRSARAVVLPVSAETVGHASHSVAALWKDELENLLQRARPPAGGLDETVEKEAVVSVPEKAVVAAPRGGRTFSSRLLLSACFSGTGSVAD